MDKKSETMDVKCSIIIPAYNAEKYIEECINSVGFEKGWEHNIEVVVINDGSTDFTHAIVEDLSKQFSNIKLVDKENTGVSASRNEGVRKAQGKYIYFMDADDNLCRNVLEEMIDCAETTGADLVVADYLEDSLEDNRQSYIANNICYNILLDRRYIEQKILSRYLNNDTSGLSSVWNKLFKKDIVLKNNIWFDEKMTYGEDWKFVIDYIENINSLYSVGKPVYKYRTNGTQNYRKYSKGIAYSLICGHKVIQDLNKKYSLYAIKSQEYGKFMKNFYDQILSYLTLEMCDYREKTRFLRSEECKNVFNFILRRNKYELHTIGLSRRDKIVAIFLRLKWYNSALKIAKKI